MPKIACQYCKGKIHIAATKCKHCQSTLLPTDNEAIAPIQSTRLEYFKAAIAIAPRVFLIVMVSIGSIWVWPDIQHLLRNRDVEISALGTKLFFKHSKIIHEGLSANSLFFLMGALKGNVIFGKSLPASETKYIDELKALGLIEVVKNSKQQHILKPTVTGRRFLTEIGIRR